MKAMLLCAGLGTRLQPITADIPKPLIPVIDRPLLDYSIRLLESAGVQDIIMNLHHLPEQIMSHYPEGRIRDLSIHYSMEPEILGTGGGLMKVENFFSGERDFILMNGDTVALFDLRKAVDHHRENRADATMVLLPFPEGESYNPVELDRDNRILRIAGRPEKGPAAVRKGLFTGIHILSPAIFNHLPRDGFSCINETGYTRMLLSNKRVLGYFADGFWSDIGTPQRYLHTTMKILADLKRFLRFFQLEPPHEIDEDVYVGRDVERFLDDVGIGHACGLGHGAQSQVMDGEQEASGEGPEVKNGPGSQGLVEAYEQDAGRPVECEISEVALTHLLLVAWVDTQELEAAGSMLHEPPGQDLGPFFRAGQVCARGSP